MRLPQRLRREQARHADDWLITYADTITLLLCLFVVMLSIKTNGKDLSRDVAAIATGLVPGAQLAPIAQTALLTRAAAPFTQAVAPIVRTATPADIFWGRVPFRPLTPATEPPAEKTWPEPVVAAPVADEAPPAAVIVVPDSAPEMAPFVSTVAEALPPAPTGHPATPRVETAQSSLPAVVDRLKSRGTAVVAQQGDRITTLQISSAAFFGSGAATLSTPGKVILLDVAATLKSSEYAAYHISIEGHTDDSPINTTQFQSNWELSTARAAAVVRFLLDQGIPARKLTAAGYADTFPLVPNRNADGSVIPENQAKNRRVVIKLEKIDKADQ